MLTKFGDNPNHDKNMRSIYSHDDDPHGGKYHWFRTVYPERSESDFFRWIDSKVCDCCANAHDNDKFWDKDNIVCGICKDIINNIIDLEHLSQIKEYMKGRKNGSNKGK